MHALLCISLLFGSVLSLSCPDQYQSIQGKCIRPLYLEQIFVIAKDLGNARKKCAKDGGHLPIIKNEEENELFKSIFNTFSEINGKYVWIVLDLVCNTATRRLEWIDGTSVTYGGPHNVDFDFDCVSTDDTVNFDGGRWLEISTTDGEYKTVMCVIDGDEGTTAKTTKMPVTGAPAQGQCGDYSLMSNGGDGAKPCIKVFTNHLSWNLAQQTCAADFGSLVTISSAEENKYFWRTAVSYNIVDGIHIGVHQSEDNTNIWTWIDGEVPITGDTYANFIGDFPIEGVGECAAMLTYSSSALWVNEDCNGANDDMLPFICRRADFSTLPKNCSTDAPKAGDDMFPPGFPNSDTPCSYILTVGANKLVELEAVTLVADPNKDFLEIFDGEKGSNLIANLTGSILSSTKFTTANSNVMRVNWKPFGAGNGRGYRIRYKEVDTL